jgi:hypothetical protein
VKLSRGRKRIIGAAELQDVKTRWRLTTFWPASVDDS